MLINKADMEKRNSGFTVVESLVVIVVLAVLAAIVLPQFLDIGERSKQTARETDMKSLRNAIEMFKTDTGKYPKTLDDLASKTAPAQGYDKSGNLQAISAGSWRGPYIDKIPQDAVTNKPYIYSTTSPTVGEISHINTATALEE